ncbi:hypothetical protein TgHK011_005593 [Trichoderma gracile]|nr:hypothetical protein TgHK011_005593 [Trichoderma gracile]
MYPSPSGGKDKPQSRNTSNLGGPPPGKTPSSGYLDTQKSITAALTLPALLMFCLFCLILLAACAGRYWWL